MADRYHEGIIEGLRRASREATGWDGCMECRTSEHIVYAINAMADHLASQEKTADYPSRVKWIVGETIPMGEAN